MYILVIKLHGKEIQRLELQSGQEYLAGRGSDCVISMEGSKGISRHHVKFFEQNGQWIAELVSRYGALIMNGEPQKTIELSVGSFFSIPPYEFAIEQNSEQLKAHEFEPAAAEEEVSKALVPILDEEQEITANREATSIGVSHLVPYLRISYADGRTETFRLEGHAWTAGREDTCEILIQDPLASRKHFELIQNEEGFFVTDLGSANGLSLNGYPLTKNKTTRLQSGDRLTIKTLTIDFEIRNSLFQNQLAVIENQWGPIDSHQPAPEMAENVLLPANYEGPAVIKIGPEDLSWAQPKRGKIDFKDKKVRMIAAGLGLLLLIWMFSPDSKKPDDSNAAATNASTDTRVPFDKLTPEQKAATRDTFNLARNLYMTGKYELCSSELKKLHELVPFYENSKELVNLCAQGSELSKVKADLEYKEEEKRRIEREIELVTESCKEKMAQNPNISDTDLNRCLTPALELDPQHPKVLELTEKVKQRQLLREEQEAARNLELQRSRHANQLYEKAKELVNNGRLREAINEYEKLLNGHYPNSTDLKGKAGRELASLKSSLKAKVDRLVEACKDLLDKNKFKDAYLSCSQAVNEDPSASQAVQLQKKSLSELRREMKSIYEDSVLEESLGNVDAAKEKWKKIMEDNINTDEYYSKAKQKLEKYGIGI